MPFPAAIGQGLGPIDMALPQRRRKRKCLQNQYILKVAKILDGSHYKLGLAMYYLRNAFRTWLRAVAPAFLIVILAWSAVVAEAAIVKRKNIDDLSPQELAAYEHAIQIMKDRSAKNPYDKTGYIWQAWVHNCPSTWVRKDGQPDGREPACDFWEGRKPPDPTNYVLANPGMCEHGKDLFLPWHRAEFYYFEKLVQGTDPNGTIRDSRGHTGPSTKEIGVPFWNFTRAPSGTRYPRAFENKTSPLYNDTRNSDPVAAGNSYAYTSQYLISYMINFQEWPEFGGYEKGKRGGYGSFESITHNPMHSQYIGGPMASPPTAALDPIFFSFHSYIDLLLEQWIEAHGSDGITSQSFFLRGEQPNVVPPAPGYTQGAGKPSMGQVKLYLDTKKLGYEFQVLEADKPINRAELARILGLDQPDPPIFGVASRNLISRLLQNGGYQANPSPSMVRTLDVAIPRVAQISNQQKFFASFARNGNEPDISYQMDVYIYPKTVSFDPGSAQFRSRYLANTGVYWGTGVLHVHDAMPPMELEVTRPMIDLINSGHSGETWTMSTGITVMPSTTFGNAAVVADPALR